MNISEKRIWQVAAGNKNRNYADLCLKWDVILNGPGSVGPWPDCKEKLVEWGLSQRKITDIKRFAVDIMDGDLVVLRLGTNEVLGVGEVHGNYEWKDEYQEFGDIDGWELQHVRRVKWFWKYIHKPKYFKTYALKLGDTVQKMDSKPVLDWLVQLNIENIQVERPLVSLPRPSSDVDWSEISEYLFDHGVGSNAIEELTQEIDELIRVSKWYQRTSPPSESETIGYLVIPLLRALGWTPQKMAIEWNNVDLALFNKLPRKDENLSVVVEAKQKDSSCLNAQSQAKAYAEKEGRSSCSRLIVTDGLRYGVYFMENGHFQKNPHAYLNLTRMREEYPLLNCKGAKDAFLYMSSDWVPDIQKQSRKSDFLD